MGVSTTHRINLSMWILIYSFSDTYYVWAACGPPGHLERKKHQQGESFFRLNFDVYSDMDNRERASARKKSHEDEFRWKKDENFVVAVRKWEMLAASKWKMSGGEKKENKNSKSKFFANNCEPQHFLHTHTWRVVSRFSSAKQRQRNVRKSVLQVQFFLFC